MCFSSTASFTAGVLIGASGVYSLNHTSQPRKKWFAAIPLLFGVQQLCEGFIWTALRNPQPHEYWKIWMYIFLIFAQVLWPTWVPLSFFMLEKNRQRKRILHYLLLAAILTSALLGSRLLFFTSSAFINEHHIFYLVPSPKWIKNLSNLLYILVTIVPTFISTVRKMKVLGIMLLLSLLVSKLFFEEELISVWCYFAALISLGVYLIIKRWEQSEQKVTSEMGR